MLHVQEIKPDSLREMEAWKTEARTMLRVEVVPHCLAIANRTLDKGVWEIDVPDSLVPMVQSMVESRDPSVPLRMHERNLAKWVADKKDPDTYPGSFEREFFNVYGDTPKPLRSCEVVRTGIAPPVSVEAAHVTNVIAATRAAFAQHAQSQAQENASDSAGGAAATSTRGRGSKS